MRPRKAPRTPEISRCRSPPRSGQSQPAPSTEAPPVDEQRSTKSARAKVLGKNSQKGPPAGKRAKKERTGGGSPRRPRAFWGPGAAFWGFLGAWGAVGKKAGNGPNRTRLIEIGLLRPLTHPPLTVLPWYCNKPFTTAEESINLGCAGASKAQ